MKRELIIHIGLMKTGSTTLQRNYFPLLEGYRYLGKDNGFVDLHLSSLYEFIGSLAFGKNETLHRSFKKFHEFLEIEEVKRYGAKNISIPLLLSHEGFTRYIFDPIYEGIYGFWSTDPKRIFSRLFDFGEVYNFNIKLILIKRKPYEFIHSFYTQRYYAYANNKHISNLNDYLRKISTDDLDQFGFSYLFNNKLENLLIGLFSDKNVYCLDFYKIFENNEQFDNHFFQIFNQKVEKFDTDIVENKKSYSYNIKKGSIKPHWLKSDGFFKSLTFARENFLYHYLPPIKQRKEIVWDDECEMLFKKIESMYKNYSQ